MEAIESVAKMATISAPSVDTEMQRAELKSVLAAPDFVRAPRLAGLLTYLCEKSFAGEAHQIKEYSIGLEVFQRGSSFDQDSDSIVRVEANRLRKRLAAFYLHEGASHDLQITIPLGQYVPLFVVRHTEPASVSSVLSTSPGLTATHSRQSRIWWLIALATLLIGALVLGLRIYRPRKNERLAAPTSSYLKSDPAGSEFGPPGGEEIRILAGADRSLVDHAGKLWSSDAGFSGGTAVKSSVQHIGSTLNPGFYRTSRQGQFRYDIPLKIATYELHLHFAETVYGQDTTGAGGEGNRLMTVKVNGQALLSHFDVIADAGASRVADVKVFAGITPSSDGQLHLEFIGENGKQALLSAIEIVPGMKGRIRPVRIVARQSPYYSNGSHWWSPDSYFEGGQLATYTQEVSGTDDPELYETERWGNFTYAIPVTPGKYGLVLHFAARHSNPGEPAPETGTTAGHVSQVFNVFCNGRALLERFDLAKEAGKTDAVIKKFAGLESNSQGKLVLNFLPVDGYATVSAIEVLPQ